MLDRKFISAEIVEITECTFKLTINYTFYSLYSFKSIFVYKTLPECINRLCLERCDNKIEIIRANGQLELLECSNG